MGILTLLRIFLGVDMALGLFNYAAWTWLFAQPFNISFLCLSLLSTHLPDADMIPYLMFRKRYRLISHWIFAHHPLLLLPLVALVSFIAAKIYAPAAVGYTVTLITTGVFLHFAHDGMHIHGFPWFSPFSLARFRFRDGQFSAVPQHELDEWREKVLHWKQNAPSAADEITVRAAPINWAELLFWVAGAAAVATLICLTRLRIF
jgi:LexA-binding, inner membrane-associated putative hydrolase